MKLTVLNAHWDRLKFCEKRSDKRGEMNDTKMTTMMTTKYKSCNGGVRMSLGSMESMDTSKAGVR